MKKLIIIFLVLNIFGLNSYSQETKDLTIKVSNLKTTHLIFPTAVKYFDYGNDDVGIGETTEPNIIKVKAVKANFKSTNLTVMTVNNIFYSIILEYENSPKKLNYFFDSKQGFSYQKDGYSNINDSEDNTKHTTSHVSNVDLDLGILELLKKTSKNSFVTGTRGNKIALILKDLYVDNNRLYFIFEAINNSSVNYDVDFVKFFIKPKKRLKKASIQDIEITPVTSVNVPSVLQKDQTGLKYFCIVLEKMTIAENKKLVVEMWENNGERSLELDISDNILINAKRIKI